MPPITKEETAFVLWGEGCDETLAVAWVSHLQAEGRRVYLVGMSGRRVRGKYGVSLTVDIGLDEALALADQAVLVIAPCDEDTLGVFHRDPRFGEFLATVEGAGARIQTFPAPPSYGKHSEGPIAGLPLWEGE